MSKTFSQFIKEVEHPEKYNKDVVDVHGLEEFPDPSEDDANFKPKVGKTATPPKGKGPIKESDEYLDSDSVSDDRTTIYNLMQRLDMIVDSILYSNQASKVNIFISHLSELVSDFDEEANEPVGETPAVPTADVPESPYASDYAEGREIDLTSGDKVVLTLEQATAVNKLLSEQSTRTSTSKMLFKNLREFNALVEFANAKEDDEEEEGDEDEKKTSKKCKTCNNGKEKCTCQ